MKKMTWMGIASLALALSACKSDGAATSAVSASAPASTSGVSVPVTVTWRPANKTTEFLSAFRPQEQ